MVLRASGAGIKMAIKPEQGNIDNIVQVFLQTNKKFQEKVAQSNAAMIGVFARDAEEEFVASLTRSGVNDEHGVRARGSYKGVGRETGRFLPFGAKSGKTFKGVPIIRPRLHQYGWGYPNVQHADSSSNFVWRTLEYGLKGGKATDLDPEEEFAPKGRHKMPAFIPPYLSRDGHYFPGSKHVTRNGPGIEGKFFLKQAWEIHQPKEKARYERLYREFVQEFGKG